MKRDAAATRDALLAAGTALFAERGYDGVSVAAIAERAGVNNLDPALIEQPARILGAVQRIVARGVRDGDFRPVDPLLTHLSLVGSLVFFFATARFRERVLTARRPRIAP